MGAPSLLVHNSSVLENAIGVGTGALHQLRARGAKSVRLYFCPFGLWGSGARAGGGAPEGCALGLEELGDCCVRLRAVDARGDEQRCHAVR